MIPKGMNFVRAVSSEGFGRIRYHTAMRRRLDRDLKLRSFFEQETAEIPQFYVERIKEDLGSLWHWLPKGALYHDPNAYLKSTHEHEQPSISMNGKAVQNILAPAAAPKPV
jgi:hypothetical protein